MSGRPFNQEKALVGAFSVIVNISPKTLLCAAPHLDAGHVDLVREVEPLALLQPGLVAEARHAPLAAVPRDVLVRAAQQQPRVADPHLTNQR